MFIARFLVLSVFAVSTTVFAAENVVDFSCSNAPAKEWGQYWALSGSTRDDFKTLDINMFGIVEGSLASETEEPVATLDIDDTIEIQQDMSKKAKSAQWKEAIPYNLSSDQLGDAILFLHKEEFKGQGQPVARLKVTEDGQEKDLRLTCRFSTK